MWVDVQVCMSGQNRSRSQLLCAGVCSQLRGAQRRVIPCPHGFLIFIDLQSLQLCNVLEGLLVCDNCSSFSREQSPDLK